MNRSLRIVALCLLGWPAVGHADDAVLERIFKDWQSIREVDDTYQFEYSFRRQHFGTKKMDATTLCEFTIHWKAQEYRLWRRGKAFFTGNSFESEETFVDNVRTRKSWKLNEDGTRQGDAPEPTVSKGDFTSTQFQQEEFPFFLFKRVVLSRRDDTYRPGRFYYEPDKSLFYVHRRNGDLVTLNVYPMSAGPARSHWQYVVDLGKKSAIRAMTLIQQFDGKPDSVFIEYLIDYKQVDSEWVVASWKRNDYMDGVLLNTAEVVVTRFTRRSTAPPITHGLSEGQTIKSVTYPPFDPLNWKEPTTEVIEYREERRGLPQYVQWLIAGGALAAVLLFVYYLRRRIRRHAAIGVTR